MNSVEYYNFYFRRWDVLMEILDAQKERISRIEIPSGMESALMNDKDQDGFGRLFIALMNSQYFQKNCSAKILTNKQILYFTI